MAPTQDRYQEIVAGIETIRSEKPYQDRADAVSALDWLESAAADLRSAQRKLEPSEIVDIAGLAADLEVLDGLSQAIRMRMTANDQRVPGRHGGPASDELTVDN